ALKPKEAFYVPVPAEKNAAQNLLEKFRGVLENESIGKTGQNIKYDMLLLKWYNIAVRGKLFDTMLAHYLLEPDMRHGMDYLSETYLNYKPVSIKELIGIGKKQLSMRDIDVQKVSDYAAEDADITLQLENLFAPRLKEAEVEKLFAEVEMPVMEVLCDMEFEGVAIDKTFLNDYSKKLEDEIKITEEKIYADAGVRFNIASPKQLGEVLFDRMKIPYEGKKTKTGQYSTDEDTLSRITGDFAIVNHLLDYREFTKLKSTYVDSIPQLINPKTGRVHTSFNQAVAATGRLSSTDPNFQNIPIRTERGREIRKAFIPRNSDYVILSADYSQIELRIIAGLSRDENMLKAFADGLDIHSATASQVFNVDIKEVTREMRGKAKAVNFGIAYGQTAFGLSQGLKISRTEAKEIIDNYNLKFPGVRQLMNDNIQFAREHGFVQTVLGRRRRLRDINSGNQTVRGFAERLAINAPIQGSAADMIKVAMINIQKEFRKQNFKSKMTLQVHDELVFDAHKSE
ncbi:MAG: DNA polymerase I, partial [Bacteroidota bacterium]